MDLRLQRLFDLLSKALEQEQALHDLVTSFRTRIEKEAEIESVRKLAAAFASSYDERRAALRGTMDELYELAKELLESGSEPEPTKATPVRPNAVADQFRQMMDTIQQKARQPSEGESATTLKSMEIELKGLVVVEEGEAKIVPPSPGSQVDAGLLSTVRMSFGTIPVLRPQPQSPPPGAASPASSSPTPTSPTPDRPAPTRPSSTPQPPSTTSRRRRKTS